MYKVKIFSPGRTKEEWLQVALGEYEKRLKTRLNIEWIDSADPTEPIYVALAIQGEMLSSKQLSQKLDKLFVQGGSRLAFVIGGPEGLSDTVIKKAIWKWSLSPLTFTHQMVRLLLVEQLYRALEIQRNSNYHK